MPTSVNPEISPAIEAVVLKAMSRSPGDRYENAREMHAALSAAKSAPRAVAPASQAGKDTLEFDPRPYSVVYSAGGDRKS